MDILADSVYDISVDIDISTSVHSFKRRCLLLLVFFLNSYYCIINDTVTVIEL